MKNFQTIFKSLKTLALGFTHTDGQIYYICSRFSDGRTISDQIAQRRTAAKSHGQFVSAIAELTDWLKGQKIINAAQKGAIDSAAAKSNKP